MTVLEIDQAARVYGAGHLRVTWRRPRRGVTPGPAAVHTLVLAATINIAAEQVNQMTSASMSNRSSGRSTLVIVLVILGILAIIAGILYVAGAANSIHFMVGSVHKGHHLARAAVSFVIGIALLIIAWFAARTHR